MLIITRKAGESIIINGNIEVIFYKPKKGNFTIGINAPKEVRVNRKEMEEEYLRQELEKELHNEEN